MNDALMVVDQRFGTELRAARELLGLSQRDVAKLVVGRAPRAGWQQSTVAKVEAGTRPVKLSEAVVLAEVLSIDLSSLCSHDVAGSPG